MKSFKNNIFAPYIPITSTYTVGNWFSYQEGEAHTWRKDREIYLRTPIYTHPLDPPTGKIFYLDMDQP